MNDGNKKNNRQENREKKPINVSGQIKSENKYYLKVSSRFRIVAFVLLAAFILFTGFMLIRYGSYITYDNLAYLVRDADRKIGGDSGSITRINYSTHDGQSFVRFRDGVAVAGATDVTVYDSSGSEVLTDKAGYSSPVLVAGDKYLLAYDIGTKYYSVYNSLTRVLSREADHEILGADMSDTGAFILLTRSKTGKFDVEVYGEALKRVMTVHKDKYVIDAAISRDGKRVAVLSAVEGDLELGCELYVCRVGESDPLYSETFPSAAPLRLDYYSTGNLSVITDSRVVFYDVNMDELSSADLSGTAPSACDATDGALVVASAENALGNRNKIIVFDNGGKMILSDTVDTRVTFVAAPSSVSGGIAGYVKTDGSVTILTAAGEAKTVGCSNDVTKLIEMGNGVLAFTPSGASILTDKTDKK